MLGFYGEMFLGHQSRINWKAHPFLAVSGCLFNTFTVVLFISESYLLRTQYEDHAVVTRDKIRGISLQENT